MPYQPTGETTGPRALTELPAARRARAVTLPETPPFRFWVDPAAVRFVAGEAVYQPVRVDYVPGLHGMRTAQDYGVVDSYQQRLGRVPVPLDMPVTAWGEKVASYLVVEDGGTDAVGKRLVHHRDAWTRYRRVGSRLIVEYDREGWLAFCRQISELVGEPDPAVVEATRVREQQMADTLEGYDRPSSTRVARQIRERITPTAEEAPAQD